MTESVRIDEAGLVSLAATVGGLLAARGWMIATAESCTGGAIARALTDTAGSSAWFECGLVTYSNAAKTRLLGVPADLIERHGAVSEPVVAAMALGALVQGGAQCAVAVTGVAGPGGGAPGKPVGTVWFGWARAVPGCAPEIHTAVRRFDGDRGAVRLATAAHALEHLRSLWL